MGRFIEGIDAPSGLQVVIIDDVCTKGGSTGQAIEKARDAGMKVLGAVCLVDREMGARELLERKYNCPFDSIFTLTDLLRYKSGSQLAPEPVGANV
jgi:orotate phosphoribosyltransferase